jgi:hypothetical protein
MQVIISQKQLEAYQVESWAFGRPLLGLEIPTRGCWVALLVLLVVAAAWAFLAPCCCVVGDCARKSVILEAALDVFLE